MKIIGIHGLADTGKDTVANLLCRSHGCAKESFARPIYEAISAITDLTVAELQDRSKKEQPLDILDRSPRYLLQTLGTEWGRDLVGFDVWVRLAEKRIRYRDNLYEDSGYAPAAWVMSDVRFEEEAAWVREHGTLIHLTRDAAAPVIGHVSELGVEYKPQDILLENNGTLDQLREDVADIARHLSLPAFLVAARQTEGVTA